MHGLLECTASSVCVAFSVYDLGGSLLQVKDISSGTQTTQENLRRPLLGETTVMENVQGLVQDRYVGISSQQSQTSTGCGLLVGQNTICTQVYLLTSMKVFYVDS